MKKTADFVYRELALSALTCDFERDRPLKMSNIETLQMSLLSDEVRTSVDTIASMKMRSLLAAGEPLQAYKILVAALRQDPLNLSLQLELNTCLAAVADALNSLFGQNPNNHMIEIYYGVLYDEAFLSCYIQNQYMNYLIRQERFAEALAIASPLIELFPAMLGLRDAAEQIAIHFPDSRLADFLRNPPKRVVRQIETRRRTPEEIISLKQTYGKLSELVQSAQPNPTLARMFTDTIGEGTDSGPLDVNLRDIYFLKAIYESKLGNSWAAIELLQSLVEVDPFNLYFRRTLNVEVSRFCEKGDFKIDPRKIYAVLREFAVVPFSMIKSCAMSHVGEGSTKEARKLMDSLLKLNSLDNDYLIASLEVALASNDSCWIEAILGQIAEAVKLRPWDLRLLAVESAGRE